VSNSLIVLSGSSPHNCSVIAFPYQLRASVGADVKGMRVMKTVHPSLILSHVICLASGSVTSLIPDLSPSVHLSILSPQCSPVLDGYFRNKLSVVVGDDFGTLKLRYDHLKMIKGKDDSRRTRKWKVTEFLAWI
jgi:hypothetical protein